MMLRLFLLLCVSNMVLGQDANKTVASVISHLNRVKNYSVDARIKSDIP